MQSRLREKRLLPGSALRVMQRDEFDQCNQVNDFLHLFKEHLLAPFLTLRLGFRLACSMKDIFSSAAHFKNSEEVLQSGVKKTIPCNAEASFSDARGLTGLQA